MLIWGGIGIVLISVLIYFIFHLLGLTFKDGWSTELIYASVIRLAILGFLGYLLGFSLKILKSYMHIKEHYHHRFRIANSMASFVESANNKDHRDIILTKLIESVMEFGSSGMINNDDEKNSKISIDNLAGFINSIKSS
jgi:hypothetical protein